MSRRTKIEAKERASTRQLMDILGITDYCLKTGHGDIVYFDVNPTNISVLSYESVSARINALMNVLMGQADFEMFCVNSRESFEDNKSFLKKRMDADSNPAIRKLLELDAIHLDRMQTQMATAREFFILIRLKDERQPDLFPRLSRIEKSLNDQGFTAHRAGQDDIKRLLGVYYEQDVTTEKHEDYDGERWVILGE